MSISAYHLNYRPSADRENRTPNRRVTKPVLYQLSYVSETWSGYLHHLGDVGIEPTYPTLSSWLISLGMITSDQKAVTA